MPRDPTRPPITLALLANSESRMTQMTMWREGGVGSSMTLTALGAEGVAPVHLSLPLPPTVKGSISCPYCRGDGKVYLHKDRDPIEGSKMQSPVTCTVCEGVGRLFPGTHDAVIYLDQLRLFYEQVNKEIRDMTSTVRAQRRAEIISRLSAEELEILGVETDE